MVKRVKIPLGLLVVFAMTAVFCSSSFAAKKPKTIEKRVKVYQDLIEGIEKQYQRLEKFTDKKLFKRRTARFGGEQWDEWVWRWDEKNVAILEKAGNYREQDEFVYENFMLTLRALNLLAFEYRRFFYAQKSIFVDIDPLKRQFEAKLSELKEEIHYLDAKGRYILY